MGRPVGHLAADRTPRPGGPPTALRRLRSARRSWNWRGPVGCRCWRAPTRWGRRRPAWARSWAAHWTPGATGSWWGWAVRPSTDGGTGALTALGARFLDAAGSPLPPGGGALADLAAGGPERAAAAPGRRGDLPDRRHRPAARAGRGGGGVRAAEGRRWAADRPAGGGAGPARRGARRGSGRPGCRGRGRDRLRAGRRLGRGPRPGGGGTVPAWRAWTGRWPARTWSSPGRDGSTRPR